jgi:5-methyltetrahydropteroyltriglutamate--homocysteine methyltransferase
MSLETSELFFDDIGSYPLPSAVRLDSLSQEQYLQLVKGALAQKIAAGVEVPTYPQFRDMIKMFMEPIEKAENQESPYFIKKEAAEILELHAVPLSCQVRVCITGPIELYLYAFGATNYSDILYNLAKSVARFLERALESGKMSLASLDEPSLGISSAVVFNEEEIQKALEIASRPCRGMDCEVHLHSPLYAELCAQVPGLSIIGVESAAHPDYLKLIDRKILEDTDTYLRAGIARTDILSMAASLNDRMGINLWEDPAKLELEILAMESPQVIESRLEAAYGAFGKMLKAVGPDCGLGSWPSQSIANKLLSNTAAAIASFRRKNEH